jgi:hypothetical protein
MTPTISAEQGGALYDQIVGRLSGIGDIWIAFAAEDYEAAERLGRQYSDELRILSEDLGWGRHPEGPIELSAPPDVLGRALRRLRDAAVAEDAERDPERLALRESERRTHLVVEACGQVLAELGS